MPRREHARTSVLCMTVAAATLVQIARAGAAPEVATGPSSRGRVRPRRLGEPAAVATARRALDEALLLPLEPLAVQPLLVLKLSRSGSTWLTALLNEQPGVVVHEEVAPHASVNRSIARATHLSISRSRDPAIRPSLPSLARRDESLT